MGGQKQEVTKTSTKAKSDTNTKNKTKVLVKKKPVKTTKTVNKTKVQVKKTPVKKAPVKKTQVKKVVKKVVKKEKEQVGGAELKTTSRDRYFKAVGEDGTLYGRFKGSKPKPAGIKVLTSLLSKKSNSKKNNEIFFSIVECTRGSKCKKYDYVGQRVALDNPIPVMVTDPDTKEKKAITVTNKETGKKEPVMRRYKNIVKKAKKADNNTEVVANK